jgi:hypothetical protein
VSYVLRVMAEPDPSLVPEPEDVSLAAAGIVHENPGMPRAQAATTSSASLPNGAPALTGSPS